jgi:hypothetical protein
MARPIPADMARALAAARGRVPVRKLPAGQAEGAGELNGWASNRLAGRSGVTHRQLVLIRCDSCRYEVEIDVDSGRMILKCRNCGSRNVQMNRRDEKTPPSLWPRRRPQQKQFAGLGEEHHDELSRRAERAMRNWLSPVDRTKLFGDRSR